MKEIVYLALLLLIGQLLKTQKNHLGDLSNGLNNFIIYVSLPALILLNIPKIEFDASLIWLIIIPWLIVPISVLFALWITRDGSRELKYAMMILLPLGNTSFVGIPLVRAILGEEAVRYAMVYDLLGSFLILSIYGTFMVAKYEAKNSDLNSILKKIVTFPPFIFIIISLVIGELPNSIKPYVKTLADTLVPLALISVGYTLRIKSDYKKGIVLKAIFFKLIASPFIAILILYFFESGLIAQVAVLESAMGFMISGGILILRAGMAKELISLLVGLSILFSLISVPIIGEVVKIIF